MTQFEALGLSQTILKSAHHLGFDEPTPIQHQAIPLVLQGHDIMGLAQTGTGKTAAFGFPLVDLLLAQEKRADDRMVRALIVAPTRELVNQIAENLRKFVHNTKLKVRVVIGGASINIQSKKLERGADILVATPGRLLDLERRDAIRLDQTTFLVLDEADQMLDLGFIHDLRKIAQLVKRPRQTLMFSATMPRQIDELAKTYLTDPIRVEVTPPGKAVDKIRQTVHFVGQREKTNLLKDCLIERRDDVSLVFARTKHGAEKLMKHLVECGFKAASIHGNKSQGQRDRAIRQFKSREIDVLVATDVAARGIDIPGVSHVYNFDLPEVPENYVHRIGRTARAGADGEAVVFCSPAEIKLFKAIEKLMGLSIKVASGDEPDLSEAVSRGGGRGRGSGRWKARPKGTVSKKRPAKNPRRNKSKAKSGQKVGVATKSAPARKGHGKPPSKNRNRRQGAKTTRH